MKKILLTLLAALLLLPNMAQAATFEAGENIDISSVVTDDFYGAGELINIATDIRGDLFAAGNQVVVDGNVSQDTTVGAGNTLIKGEIADDLRVATGTLNVSAVVKGDILAAAGTITIDDNSFVGGDLYAAGGQMLINGNINGDLKLAGDKDGSVRIDSVIGGSVGIIGFEHITFGPDAKILGDFWYRAPEPIEIPEGAVEGEIIFKPIQMQKVEKTIFPALMAGFSLFKLLSLLFFGLFFIWLCRFFLVNAAARAYEATLKSLGIGALILILTPVVAVILLMTTIGIPLALVMMGIWLIALYLAKVMAAILIGFKIIRVDDKSGFGRTYGSFALGALIFTIIGLVPFVGWIINALFVLIALGGMMSHKIEVHDHLKKKKLC
jgi:hypothetical protein